MVSGHKLFGFCQWSHLESKDCTYNCPYSDKANNKTLVLEHKVVPFGPEKVFDFRILLFFALLLKHFNFISVFIAAAEYSSAVKRALTVNLLFINDRGSREEQHDKNVVHLNNHSSEYAE
jgi:hypothetical protein